MGGKTQTHILEILPEASWGEYDSEEGFINCINPLNVIEGEISSLMFLKKNCFSYITTSGKLGMSILNNNEILSFMGAGVSKQILAYSHELESFVLMDNQFQIHLFKYSLNLFNYKFELLNGNVKAAQEDVFPLLHEDNYDKLAVFLESIGFKELAVQITKDEYHRLCLALSLSDITLAHQILSE